MIFITNYNYVICSAKLVKKKEKLDQKRKEVRNKLKYGS